MLKTLKNPDESLRNRDMVGMVILKDITFDGDGWTDGNIYDPQSGKSYSCKISLKSPDEIKVRGYVGVSMFGRTDIWTKIKN